ncbi:MAG TPA: outer membrane lipoprotein-sorting protein [Candidatus Eisenbacteria bacterium]|nr:outer membrane lipoprotein-sorting protein [Candidatus Eisenbacteria bacterium]
MVRRFLAGIALLALLAPIASAQTADELVTKNIAAKGGLEKLKAINSSRATGRMVAGPGMEFPFTMVNKRPNSTRIEFNVQGMTGIQAYDGKTAWMSMPFMGKKDPEPMAADEAKMFEEQADFDGPLVDYKAKGHSIELVGKEQVEGADAYKLKLTLKNGDVRYIYLDAETYLEIKMEAKRMVRGSEMEGESYLGDYKEVGGIMMAHSMESGAKGNPQRQKLIIDKVEMNVDLADNLFAMPAAAAGADSAATAAKGGTTGATKDAGKTAVKTADAAGKSAKSVAAAKADSAKAGKKKP